MSGDREERTGGPLPPRWEILNGLIGGGESEGHEVLPRLTQMCFFVCLLFMFMGGFFLRNTK